MSKRMTISLSEALDNDMEAMIADKRYNIATKTEALRNAFIVYKLLLDEISKGNKLAIADQNNHIIKEIVMAH